jgi:hypothetical protein
MKKTPALGGQEGWGPGGVHLPEAISIQRRKVKSYTAGVLNVRTFGPENRICVGKGGLERERRRTALLAGTFAGDAELGFRLRDDRRMCDQACEDDLGRRRNESVAVKHSDAGRVVRAFLGWRLHVRIAAGRVQLHNHVHAMMRAVAPAARRQTRVITGNGSQ